MLDSNPFCVECQRGDVLRPATDVDHVRPHRGDEQLFWDVTNLAGLCARCHTRKTARGE